MRTSVHACAFVRACVHVCERLLLCVYAHMHECMLAICVRTFTCMCVRMYVYTCLCKHTCSNVYTSGWLTSCSSMPAFFSAQCHTMELELSFMSSSVSMSAFSVLSATPWS